MWPIPSHAVVEKCFALTVQEHVPIFHILVEPLQGVDDQGVTMGATVFL